MIPPTSSPGSLTAAATTSYTCHPPVGRRPEWRRRAWSRVIPWLMIAGTTFAQERAPESFVPPPPEKILIYPVLGEINANSMSRLRKVVERGIQDDGATVIVFEFDTPGGRLDAAEEAAEFIFELDKSNVLTVAYVPNNRQCISAGALLAVACRKIAMGENSLLGDIEPIHGFTLETLPEKIQTVVRARVATYAARRGYPRVLAEAMVSKDIQVSRITRVTERGDSEVLYLSAEELEAQSAQFQNSIVQREIVVGRGKLLTMNDEQAYQYGFSVGTYTTRATLLEGLDLIGEVIEFDDTGRLDRDWGALSFVNSRFVKFLLIVLGVLGFALELKMPGLGLPGIVGLACFVLFFVIGYFDHSVGWVEVVLFMLSLALLALEVFLLPGFGVAGVLGLALLVLSLVLSLTPGTGEFEFAELGTNLLVVCCSLVASMIMIVVVLSYLPKAHGRATSGLILTTSLTEAATTRPSDAFGYPTDSPWLGRSGIVVAACRPAGKVEIGSETLSVVAEGGFIAAGTAVEVVHVEGNRVVVRPLPSGAEPSGSPS
ncbi:MAG: nodulation protein NfeD [Planctomycetota bacterium]